MKSLGVTRYALAIGAASALLVGCGGSQPPIAGPGAVSQSRAIATRVERGGSWMLPEAKGEDLLYVAACGGNGVLVFSYPRGHLVGKLSVSGCGLCSTSDGDIFLAGGATIYEYPHGGTKPIATMNDFTGNAYDCSVDPTSGNLAVTNSTAYYYGPGSVMIYKRGSLDRVYWDSDIWYLGFCTYDDRGNLFVDGATFSSGEVSFAELAKRSGRLRLVALNKTFTGVGDLQWDGKFLVVGADGGETSTLYRFKIQRYAGTEAGSITLNGALDLTWYWLQGGRVAGSVDPTDAQVSIWRYPEGGDPRRTIPGATIGGVTVSIARTKSPR